MNLLRVGAESVYSSKSLINANTLFARNQKNVKFYLGESGDSGGKYVFLLCLQLYVKQIIDIKHTRYPYTNSLAQNDLLFKLMTQIAI